MEISDHLGRSEALRAPAGKAADPAEYESRRDEYQRHRKDFTEPATCLDCRHRGRIMADGEECSGSEDLEGSSESGHS